MIETLCMSQKVQLHRRTNHAGRDESSIFRPYRASYWPHGTNPSISLTRIGENAMALTLTHVSLLVEDVQRALRFYSDTLGLEVANNFGDYAELTAGENLKL